MGMKAIQINQHGNADVLQLIEIAVPAATDSFVSVRNQAIGVNYVDVQHRQGGYYPVTLPLIPGIEAAGIVEQVGENVSQFQVGDRVAYSGYMGGNYAEMTLVPEHQLVRLPDGLSFDDAAAVLLQGMTAHCLSHDVYSIQANDGVLVHAAAGGVGSLLVQFAKQRGAKVIATVSSEKKAAFVRDLGAYEVINYRERDFAADVLSVTQSEGVHVVYDAIGKATFEQSLASLRRCGHMVIYGQTSGAIPLFDINRLSGLTEGSTRGSSSITWAALSHYNYDTTAMRSRAATVFEWVANKRLKVNISAKLPLEQAAIAHQMLKDRDAMGKILLMP
jgi:NADPH2:quinone reductase